ncbi:MAG: anti-sigma F factor [Lachnospiraceae bacterium]|nr:anti-sigma F factor [Lachnospiraceae bacterium]MCI7596081.1 anti-sigma F factor [Lachnospiraceae bacterium]MDD7049775.1 anti-sigma F factor [Lachnospiraceae bacterium]MDY3222366.1 anti-sigma F factor [Lachnospiraceae bacterium]MDY4095778.1 anti-sigma F factor [Lachnospiraceae bacterium]
METKGKINTQNWMQLELEACSENESLARIAVAAFITPLNPTLEEMADVKTAVSEAVTNAIIHGYEEKGGTVYIRCRLHQDLLEVEIEDKGKGIEDIDQAMEPLFTTKPDKDRSGMGFSFMEAFMDELEVMSIPGAGTCVSMKKKLGTCAWFEV